MDQCKRKSHRLYHVIGKPCSCLHPLPLPQPVGAFVHLILHDLYGQVELMRQHIVDLEDQVDELKSEK